MFQSEVEGRQRADVLADHPGQHDLWRVGAAGWPALAARAQAPALALRQSRLLPDRRAHRGSALRLPTLRFTPQRRQLGLARPAVAQDGGATLERRTLERGYVLRAESREKIKTVLESA